ncbi:MAG: PIN domain-containing protein [Candidatus Aenigmatarchaeota archaeon]
MKIFLDTNALISLIVETEFTEEMRKILEKYINEEFYTSINVIEETLYVLSKIFKKSKELCIKRIKELTEGLDIKIIKKLPFRMFLKIYLKYDLNPNDALVAAVCKYYKIRKIITFDRDFEKVDFLEIIRL